MIERSRPEKSKPMTTTDISIDPTLYQLFERIVREAPSATEYEIDRTGTRQNGTTYKYTQRLDRTQKDQIPWGTHDAIIGATWWAPNWAGVANMEYTRVFVDSFNNGIGVGSTLDSVGQHIVILAEREHTDTGSSLIRHYLTSEDSVVAKVLEFIQAAVDEANATSDSEVDYDEDRHDSLNELSTPAHLR